MGIVETSIQQGVIRIQLGVDLGFLTESVKRALETQGAKLPSVRRPETGVSLNVFRTDPLNNRSFVITI